MHDEPGRSQSESRQGRDLVISVLYKLDWALTQAWTGNGNKLGHFRQYSTIPVKVRVLNECQGRGDGEKRNEIRWHQSDKRPSFGLWEARKMAKMMFRHLTWPLHKRDKMGDGKNYREKQDRWTITLRFSFYWTHELLKDWDFCSLQETVITSVCNKELAVISYYPFPSIWGIRNYFTLKNCFSPRRQQYSTYGEKENITITWHLQAFFSPK